MSRINPSPAKASIHRITTRINSTAFSPRSIPGMRQWLDASTLSNGADGDPVSAWSDYSGQGNDVSQATAAKRPTLRRTTPANLIGGLPTVSFDGVDDYLLNTLDLTGAKTMFIVARLRALPGVGVSNTVLRMKSAASTFSELSWLNVAGYQPRSFRHDHQTSGLSVGLADALTTTARLSTATFNGADNSTPANYTAALDGVAKTVVASSLFGATATDKNSIGARVSSADAVTNPAPVDLAALLIYNSVLSAGDQLAVTTYLKTRYSIA